jgi:hypothetical protein
MVGPRIGFNKVKYPCPKLKDIKGYKELKLKYPFEQQKFFE